VAESFAFRLRGIEPTDNTFRGSDESVKRAFWAFVARKGLEVFRRRCNRGLDRFGRPLIPIAESTRRRGRWRSHTGQGTADNPPLVPAMGLSRTEELLRGRGFVDHAEWHWAVDEVTGKHWGRILGYHRAGLGRGLYRDVIGWSDDDVAELRQYGAVWWHGYRNAIAVAEAAERLELPAERMKQLATREPVRFRVTGRIDIDRFTFGIGAQRETVRRSIDEGYFSGFRQLGKPRPPAAAAAKPRPKPRPPAVLHAASLKPKPAAAPAPAPKPQPATPPPDLAEFARRVLEVAATVDESGRFGPDKVFISAAWAAYVRRYGPIGLTEFKRLLALATNARYLDLSRANMVEAMDAATVAASETTHPLGIGEWHFVRLGRYGSF